MSTKVSDSVGHYAPLFPYFLSMILFDCKIIKFPYYCSLNHLLIPVYWEKWWTVDRNGQKVIMTTAAATMKIMWSFFLKVCV